MNYTAKHPTTQLNLFDPADEAGQYLFQRGGYFAHLVATASGKRQRLYPVDQLEAVLDCVDLTVDNWISQALFWSGKRRVVNVKSLSLIFLDLDIYKLPLEQNWAYGRTPEQMADAFMVICDSLDVPRPSLIIFSGRGIQPKWLIDAPLPRLAIPRWSAVENELVERFRPYGADVAVKDAARVLRIVQTRNSRSDDICRVVGKTAGEDGKPIRYSFEYLCECILPFGRGQRKKIILTSDSAERIARVSNGYNLATLNWQRQEDLRTLLSLRGTIPEGQRMLFLMYLMNFLALSNQVTPGTFYREAEHLASEIDPSWTHRPKELQTVFEKMRSYKAGERIDFFGVKHVPLYTPKSETLIELFNVTPEEMAHLVSIVDEGTRRQRHAVASLKSYHRVVGGITRQEYEGHAKARKERAIALRREGLSLRKIAEEMGISKSRVQQYLTDF